jgi:hypothetical protein
MMDIWTQNDFESEMLLTWILPNFQHFIEPLWTITHCLNNIPTTRQTSVILRNPLTVNRGITHARRAIKQKEKEKK